jgi:hypothetical protein
MQIMSFNKIPAEEAMKRVVNTSGSKWPSRVSPARMLPVCLPDVTPGFTLDLGESVFTIGSCFARHIEYALRDVGFQVPALDFQVPETELLGTTKMVAGILNKYTPMSMLNEVKFALSSGDGREFLIEVGQDRFLDGQLHTDKAVSLERGLERREQLRSTYRNALKSSRVVVITLGLVEAWWDEQEQVYLNDTVHRAALARHPNRFFFERIGPEKTISVVCELIQTLAEANKDQHVLLTVSPVPFARSFSGDDAIVANTYSKAVLRVAAEVARDRFGCVDYYPSFESVTHTDRDVAWEDDLIHVRKGVVQANVQRMLNAYARTEAEAAPR